MQTRRVEAGGGREWKTREEERFGTHLKGKFRIFQPFWVQKKERRREEERRGREEERRRGLGHAHT